MKLYVDQYGNKFYARTVKELRKQIANGGSRVSCMYRNRGNQVFKIGYVIGDHWLAAYKPLEEKVN